MFEIYKNSLIPYNLGFEKIRIGKNYDGGYVLAKELLNKAECVYSLGVGNECSFDEQLANMGLKIFMYDGSVDGPPIENNNFFFNKEFINHENFVQAIEKNGHLNNKNMIAQIDIEGNEFSFLSNTKDEILLKFSQICIEFHEMHFQYLKDNSWIDKILNNFYIFHMHGNNIGMDGREGRGYVGTYIDGFPNVLEVTFIRKDLVTIQPTIDNTEYPIKDLDFPNAYDKQDYKLNWWVK
jgi:hypothetical protein